MANDNRTLFYVIKDEETLLPCRYTGICWVPVLEDVLAYEERIPRSAPPAIRQNPNSSS